MSERSEETLRERWLRRCVTVPVLFVSWLFVCGLLPFWLILSAIVDLAGKTRWAVSRAVLSLALYLTCEMAVIGGYFVLWLAFVLPLGWTHQQMQMMFVRLQRWGAGVLWIGVRHFFSIDLDIEGDGRPEAGPYLLFCRYASFTDFLLALALVNLPYQMPLRGILRRESRWDPAIDLIGSRLGYAFLSKGAEQDFDEMSLTEAVQGQSQTLLHFPEAVAFSEKARKESLHELSQTSRQKLQGLRSLMPPQVERVLSLLTAAPKMDVVFCAHVGYEYLSSPVHLLHGLPVGMRVHVLFWRVAVNDIPAEREARIDWLYQQWRRMDEWVEARTRALPPLPHRG